MASSFDALFVAAVSRRSDENMTHLAEADASLQGSVDSATIYRTGPVDFVLC